jgi:hypothetical protein
MRESETCRAGGDLIGMAGHIGSLSSEFYMRSPLSCDEHSEIALCKAAVDRLPPHVPLLLCLPQNRLAHSCSVFLITSSLHQNLLRSNTVKSLALSPTTTAPSTVSLQMIDHKITSSVSETQQKAQFQ